MAQPFLDELAKMSLQHFLESGCIVELSKSGGKGLRVLVDEPALDEILDKAFLREALLDLHLILEAPDHGGRLAIQQEVREISLPGCLECVLELPFRTGDGLARQRSGKLLHRQRHAQA